jgi:hypothetical protein
MAIAQPKTNRRYVDRTVAQLHDGDVFTLDIDSDNATWHTATGMAHSGMVVVAVDGGCIRIPAEPDQACLVEVDYVKVGVRFTMVIDVAAWAAEYSVDREDVEADIRTYFSFDVVRRNFIPEHLRPFVTIKGSDEDPLA